MGLFDVLKRGSSSKAGVVEAEPLPAVGAKENKMAPQDAAAPVLASMTPGTRTRQRVLFVAFDPEAAGRLNILTAPLTEHWDRVVADCTALAFDLLAKRSYDAVIVETLTGNPEIQFINAVGAQYPRILRFLRCGANHRGLFMSCTGDRPVQAISNECDSEGLASVVNREFNLDIWLSDPVLKKLIGRMHTLPSLPTLYTQVINELQRPAGSLEFVARLIGKDPVMAAKVLQLVNSVVFGVPRQISDPKEAVLFLGSERTKSLILLSKVFSQFDTQKWDGLSLDRLWHHSMSTGAFAQSICLMDKKTARLGDTAFTAGLLHDIGKLLLAGNLPDEYNAILAQSATRRVPVRTVEREILGTDHAAIGAALLGTWGLPLPILHAIGWHHAPQQAGDKEFSLLTAVHVANVIDHEKKGEDGSGAEVIDAAYLDTLGLRDRRNPWREKCGARTRAQDSPLVERIGSG